MRGVAAWQRLVREACAAASSARTAGRVPGARAEVVMLGDTAVHVEVEGRGALCFVNVHENESTSVAAARAVFDPAGARLVRLCSRGRRFVVFRLGWRPCAFDPNRIFTDAGMLATLARYAADTSAAAAAVLGLRQRLLAHVAADGVRTVVALHNHRGGLSIGDYAPRAPRAANAAALHVGEPSAPGDFMLVTGPAHFEALAARGFNVVLQHAQPPDDGSMSVWFGRQGRNYVNVEAVHGRREAQQRMLRAVVDTDAALAACADGPEGRAVLKPDA